MNKFSLILLSACFSGVAMAQNLAVAQQVQAGVPLPLDTVYTKSSSRACGEVLSIPASPNRPLKIRRNPDGKVVRANMTDITEIRFKDGFRLTFTDGLPDRGGLLSCPTLKPSYNEVRAEGLLTLTGPELKQFYGDCLYHLEYEPNSSGAWNAFARIAAGALGTLGGVVLKKDTYSYWGSYKIDYKGQAAEQHYKQGYIKPSADALFSFSIGMALVGAGDLLATSLRNRYIFEHYETLEPHSRKWAQAELWGGIGACAVGLGMMGASYVHLSKHQTWNETRIVSEDGQVLHESTDGTAPSLAVRYGLMMGGALLSNIGLSAIIHGSKRLRGYARLSANGLTYTF